MRRFSSILVAGLLLASCNVEETANDEKVEVEQEQTEIVNPKTELDEDYKANLDFHTEDNLKSFVELGEKMIHVYYSKMDAALFEEIKDDVATGAYTKAENFSGGLDANKEYKIEEIEHEYVQGEDAPRVKLIYLVSYREISNNVESEIITNEFKIEGSNRRDSPKLAILEFEDKTHLDANSLFN